MAAAAYSAASAEVAATARLIRFARAAGFILAGPVGAGAREQNLGLHLAVKKHAPGLHPRNRRLASAVA
jgi:hypothetical protein